MILFFKKKLASDERIIIYGGAVSISADGKYTASSPDLAILDTTNNNFVWSQPKASGTAPPQIAYHSASLVGDYMIVSFGKCSEYIVCAVDIMHKIGLI